MKKKLSIVVCLAPTLAQAQSPPQGEWEDSFWFGPSFAERREVVHMIHMFDGSAGKMLVLTRKSDGTICPPGSPMVPGDLARVWTPPPMGSPPGDPGVFEEVALCRETLFCGGHSALADGRILCMGGGESEFPHKQADIFDPLIMPSSAAWNNPTLPPDMAENRWYPTSTTLGDGRVLITSGRKQVDPTVFNTIPELYYPPDWPEPWPPYPNTFVELPTEPRQQKLYPYMFLLPDGNVVDADPQDSRILDTTTWTWGATPIPKPPTGGPFHNQGFAAMYEPGKIVACGGSNNNKATWVLDATSPNAAWLVASDMIKPRRNHNLVVMPDGKVLAVGGHERTDPMTGERQAPVFEAEIFEPGAGNAAWTLQPAMAVGHERMYHSTAMLLQDGRVVAAGGDNRPTGQIFRPPYITSGAPRPIITDAPLYIKWGEGYVIDYVKNGGPAVTRACLTRLGSVTHDFDQDQRRVPLTITASIDGPQPSVTVAAPIDGNIAPPGYYMLWILNEYANNQFAPCELAAYVQVGP